MVKEIVIGLAAIAVAVILLTVWLILAHMHDHVKTHGAHRIIGRAVSGRRTDGKRHTNASFWRKSDGRVIGHPVGRVSKRHHRAGIANLTRTVTWVFALLLIGYGATQALTMTFILAGIAFGGILIYQAVKTVIRLREWYLKRLYISPLAEALGARMGITGPELEESIHMEPGYMEKKNGTIGRIDLPPRFHADNKEQDSINGLISSRLPVGADFDWRFKGRTPHILITAAPPLPAMVPFKDYIPEIKALGKRQYISGVDRTGKPYIASFAGENPHHGYCWGTGRGKSSILMSIIAQVFHNDPDATGTVIDPKEISLDDFVGIPGLDFYNDADNIPGMWTGLAKVHDLMDKRYRELREDPTKEFPAHLLIMEEANSFAVMSKVYWQRNRPKGEPITPPMWADDVAPIFWRARQAGIFIVLVAQSLQERFLGNLNLRPSLGLISMSGYKPSQWQNIVGTTPIPRPQKGRGRAIYIDGDEETWIQALYGSPKELRDFACENRRNLIVPDTETVAKVNGLGNVPAQIRRGTPTETYTNC